VVSEDLSARLGVPISRSSRHRLNINKPLMSLGGDKVSPTGYGWRVEDSGD